VTLIGRSVACCSASTSHFRCVATIVVKSTASDELRNQQRNRRLTKKKSRELEFSVFLLVKSFLPRMAHVVCMSARSAEIVDPKSI